MKKLLILLGFFCGFALAQNGTSCSDLIQQSSDQIQKARNFKLYREPHLNAEVVEYGQT